MHEVSTRTTKTTVMAQIKCAVRTKDTVKLSTFPNYQAVICSFVSASLVFLLQFSNFSRWLFDMNNSLIRCDTDRFWDICFYYYIKCVRPKKQIAACVRKIGFTRGIMHTHKFSLYTTCLNFIVALSNWNKDEPNKCETYDRTACSLSIQSDCIPIIWTLSRIF